MQCEPPYLVLSADHFIRAETLRYIVEAPYRSHAALVDSSGTAVVLWFSVASFLAFHWMFDRSGLLAGRWVAEEAVPPPSRYLSPLPKFFPPHLRPGNCGQVISTLPRRLDSNLTPHLTRTIMAWRQSTHSVLS
jgi:hypothetical protein